MPSRRRRSPRPAALVLAVALAGCGSGVGTGAPPDPVPSTAPASAVADCAAVEPLGPIPEGNKVGMISPDLVLMGVLATYGKEHPDTYAGSWIAREHGGTVVVAFTDDPEPHRAAIRDRRPSPDDVSMVRPPPSITATTTVGESGWVVAVVRVRFSEARLREIYDQVRQVRGTLEGAGVSALSRLDALKNRVSLKMEPADEAARATVARHLPAEALCVEAPPRNPTEGVPRPATLIPAEGSDPYLYCEGLPLRRSALDHPPVLPDDDPLLVAFRQSAATGNASVIPGGPDGWRLFAVHGDRAVFVSERPRGGTVTMERRNGRWLWANSSGGGGGGPRVCNEVLPPEGLHRVGWKLDPGFPPPAPADTTVHLLVTHEPCAGDQPIGDRLVSPEVRVAGGQMLIGLGARSLPSRGCQEASTETVKVDVTLPEPLGARTLADGTLLPPRAPTG